MFGAIPTPKWPQRFLLRNLTMHDCLEANVPQLTNAMIDDLDVLLQFAAAHDHAHRERHRQILAAAVVAENTKDAVAKAPLRLAPDSDDLSVVLRWAASQDSADANKRARPPSVSSSWSPIKPTVKSQSKNERGHTEWVLPALLP